MPAALRPPLTSVRDTFQSWRLYLAGMIIDKLTEVVSTMDIQVGPSCPTGPGRKSRLVMLTGGLMRNHFIVEQIQAHFRSEDMKIHSFLDSQAEHGDR